MPGFVAPYPVAHRRRPSPPLRSKRKTSRRAGPAGGRPPNQGIKIPPKNQSEKTTEQYCIFARPSSAASTAMLSTARPSRASPAPPHLLSPPIRPNNHKKRNRQRCTRQRARSRARGKIPGNGDNEAKLTAPRPMAALPAARGLSIETLAWKMYRVSRVDFGGT